LPASTAVLHHCVPIRRARVVSSSAKFYSPSADSTLLPLGLVCETQLQFAALPQLPMQYVLPHYTLMDIDVRKVLRQERRKVITWTVNRMESMLQFQEMGVDGIISDDTQTLAKLRG
jgi:glycerophosphoryl diester phosphodiesterase